VQGNDSITADEVQGAKRWIAQEIFRLCFTAVILFGLAGRLDWPGAWIVLIIYAVWITANTGILYRRSPGLLAERSKRQRSAIMADTVFLTIYGIAVISKYVLAGLEVRNASVPRWEADQVLIAAIMAALGYALVTWSMWANAYFPMVLRIQGERGQQVIDQGPYRFVRHPGYLGSAIFDLATPFVLGSSWALPAGIIAAIAIIIRAVREDRYLRENLEGYEDYASRVKSRLIPWFY